MTSTELVPLNDINLTGLRQLQTFCYEASKSKGFYEDRKYHTSVESMRSYRGNKLMLMVGELIEAHEELRNGRALTETYYKEDKPGKPEGIPSELADTLIRLLDFCGAEKIDLVSIIIEKLEYNATRERLHGRKF